jgi:large subunit ribosomal protein L21
VYAVIETGGKQYRVSEGERVEVERLSPADDGAVSFTPVLLIDGDQVIAGRGALASASVSGRVVGDASGPKITGFTYQAKARRRRRWGHRQKYSVVEITGITKG